MSDPFIGEIRMFTGKLPPKNWALCNGYVIPIAQSTTLYSLLGTIYGGDGRTTFCLPDLRGRVPIGQGRGSGMSYYAGYQLGVKEVPLTSADLPSHSHPLKASNGAMGNTENPLNNIISRTDFNLFNNDATSESMVQMWEGSIDSYGESNPSPHDNMQPYTCISFIICLNGIFPKRS